MCMELQCPCWALQRGLVEHVSCKLLLKSPVPFSLCPLRPEGKEEGSALFLFHPSDFGSAWHTSVFPSALRRKS